MNNFSMFTADRMTHLKVVAMALVCATLVAGLGVAARVTDAATADGRLEATVIKAGDRVAQRGARDPLTVLRLLNPRTFRAFGRAFLFLGLRQDASASPVT